MKLTDKAKEFLLPCNNERIEIIGFVNGHYTSRVKHNCYNDKHNEYSIVIKDVKAKVDGKLAFIKRLITLTYNPQTSEFSTLKEGDNIKFYARINICEDNLYISRPSRITVMKN
jgi:hypothetical protein